MGKLKLSRFAKIMKVYKTLTVFDIVDASKLSPDIIILNSFFIVRVKHDPITGEETLITTRD